jgi:hypothetical protein
MPGKIKGEVRKLKTRTETKPYGQNRMINVTIWSFLIERYDDNNNPLPPVSAEIRGSKLFGTLDEGDVVEIVGGRKREGTIVTKKIYNLTTKSFVESKKAGCAGIIMLFIITGAALGCLLHQL